MYVGSIIDPSVPAPSKNETAIVATMDANDLFTNVYSTIALVLCLLCPTRWRRMSVSSYIECVILTLFPLNE
jgi:hypothetical protein